jgi:hypothetical protein
VTQLFGFEGEEDVEVTDRVEQTVLQGWYHAELRSMFSR